MAPRLAVAARQAGPKVNPIRYYEKYEIKVTVDGETYEYTLEDLMVVEYEDSTGIHRTIIGLTKPLPKGVLAEPQHVAAKLFTKEFLEKLGYEILEEEKRFTWRDGRVILDYFAKKLNGKMTIVECKHGDELKSRIDQADNLFEIVKENDWKLIYSFLHVPQTPEAKKLFNHLVNLMKQYPNIVEIYIGGEKYEVSGG
ncbi:MAG: hypothetical protein ACPL4E_04710 [Thermoproteota archaeon]